MRTLQGVDLPENLVFRDDELTSSALREEYVRALRSGVDPDLGLAIIAPARLHDAAYSARHRIEREYHAHGTIQIMCVSDEHSGWALRALDWFPRGPTQGGSI